MHEQVAQRRQLCGAATRGVAARGITTRGATARGATARGATARGGAARCAAARGATGRGVAGRLLLLAASVGPHEFVKERRDSALAQPLQQAVGHGPARR
eukprot:scaffold130552_cov48-Phaeocystis_antarctica.AAC.2